MVGFDNNLCFVLHSDDIELIKLDQAMPHSVAMMPVCMPSSAPLPSDRTVCYATGWGYTGTYDRAKHRPGCGSEACKKVIQEFAVNIHFFLKEQFNENTRIIFAKN